MGAVFMYYLFDKLGKRIGHVKTGRISYCFNNNGNFIGRIAQSGNYIYLYNANGSMLGLYNGRNTLDKHSNYLGKGNLLYYILYPTLATIR